jgi:hypothetical protein
MTDQVEPDFPLALALAIGAAFLGLICFLATVQLP